MLRLIASQVSIIKNGFRLLRIKFMACGIDKLVLLADKIEDVFPCRLSVCEGRYLANLQSGRKHRQGTLPCTRRVPLIGVLGVFGVLGVTQNMFSCY